MQKMEDQQNQGNPHVLIGCSQSTEKVWGSPGTGVIKATLNIKMARTGFGGIFL